MTKVSFLIKLAAPRQAAALTPETRAETGQLNPESTVLSRFQHPVSRTP
jgi:hypothetical protein